MKKFKRGEVIKNANAKVYSCNPDKGGYKIRFRLIDTYGEDTEYGIMSYKLRKKPLSEGRLVFIDQAVIYKVPRVHYDSSNIKTPKFFLEVTDLKVRYSQNPID